MTGRDESIGKSFKTVEDGINAVLDRFDCFDVDRMVVLKIADRLVTLDPKISKEGIMMSPGTSRRGWLLRLAAPPESTGWCRPSQVCGFRGGVIALSNSLGLLYR